MRLKQGVDVISFLKAAKACTDEVYFYTPSGDRLDLRSELMGYVFISQSRNEGFLYQSHVEITGAEDLERLSGFVTG